MRRLSDFPFVLDSIALERLKCFEELLLAWNKTHNLTGAKDSAAIEAYIVDSLYPLSLIPPFCCCVDIGTGAGFPGLILAIAKPKIPFYLVEPIKKRAAFLRYCALELGLEKVVVCDQRIENLRGITPDLITSRAVAPTRTLLSLASHLIQPSSTILFYKGERVYEEAEGLEGFATHQIGHRHYLLKKGVI